MNHKILIAVDDSDSSREAVRVVHELFGDDSNEILGINVAERPPQWVPPGVGYGMTFPAFPLLTADGDLAIDAELRDHARTCAMQMTNESHLADAAPIGAVGDPAATILAAAAERTVDLLVVGSDAPGFLDRVLDRSIALLLVRDAHIPVLVVPSPHTDAEVTAAPR